MFGPGYSGLEYDYRGLLKLYHSTGNAQKALDYRIILQDWNQIRDHNNDTKKDPFEIDSLQTVNEVVSAFRSLSA